MKELEAFKKIQISVSLNKKSVKPNIFSFLSVEVGYPDSDGLIVWKGSSRAYNGNLNAFSKNTSRDGKEIDAIVPATWQGEELYNTTFVFDFVKNKKTSIIKIRQAFSLIKDYIIHTEDFSFKDNKADFRTPELLIKTAIKIIGEN